LFELPQFPAWMTSTNDSDFGETIFGRCRQFVKARMKPGLSQKGGGHSMLTAQDKKENDKKTKRKEAIAEALLMLSPLTPGASDVKEQQRLAAEAPGFDKTKREIKAGMGPCPTCQGTHPDCSSCPDEQATLDDKFVLETYQTKGYFCTYRHQGRGLTCTGRGHMVRHHFPVQNETAKKESAEHRKSPEFVPPGGKKHNEKKLDFARAAAPPNKKQEFPAVPSVKSHGKPKPSPPATLTKSGAMPAPSLASATSTTASDDSDDQLEQGFERDGDETSLSNLRFEASELQNPLDTFVERFATAEPVATYPIDSQDLDGHGNGQNQNNNERNLEGYQSVHRDRIVDCSPERLAALKQ
jgi:hypothetical protein